MKIKNIKTTTKRITSTTTITNTAQKPSHDQRQPIYK